MTTLKTKIHLNQKDFEKTYSELIGVVANLTEGQEKVLKWISFNLVKSELHIDHEKIVAISKSSGLAVGSVRNRLTELKEKNILIRSKKYSNMYRINPDFCFGKSDSKSFKFVLTLEMEVK